MSALVLSEGPDDVRALHEILTRGFGLEGGPRPAQKWRNHRLFVHVNETVHLGAAGDRDQLLSRTASAFAEHWFIENQITRVGLVFDPDKHDEEAWRQWLYDGLISRLDAAPTKFGWSITTDTDPIEIVPIPWDAGGPFDNLDIQQNLERVGIGILQAADPEQAQLILDLLKSIQDTGHKTTWKTAFRLLNAVRAPETEDGFYARAFGQDKILRGHVMPLLETTRLAERLRYVTRAIS